MTTPTQRWNEPATRPRGVPPAPGTLRLAVLAPARAGADARWSAEAAVALAGLGHDVTLFATARSASHLGATAGELRSGSLSRRPRAWSSLGQWRELRDLGPDAVLVTESGFNRKILESRLLWRSPPVLLEVCSELASRPERAPSLRLRAGVRTLAPSETVDRNARRRQLHLPRLEALAVVVAGFEAGSAHATILAAWAALEERYRESRSALRLPTLGFVGSGSEEHELRALAQRSGLRERVLWLGTVPDARPYVQAADLLLVADSSPESGWRVLEAQACGVPVVAPDVPPAAQLVEPARTGLLVQAADAEALAATVDGLLRDPGLAARLGNAGREAVETQRSHRALGCELEALVHARLLRDRGWAESQAGRRALFVDRDGTLVFDEPYNADPARLRLLPEVGPALRAYRATGASVVVVSNQSAVARGWCAEADVRATNARLRALVQAAGADLDAIYYCPHHPDFGPACTCRKPEPGMLLQAAAEHGLDLAGSLTVGDGERDLEAGRRAGTRTLRYRLPESAPLEALESSATKTYTDWLELIRETLREAWQASTRPRQGLTK